MFHNIARYVFFYVGDTYSVLRSLFPWAQPKGRGWTKPSSKVIFPLQRLLHQRARHLVQSLSFRAQAGEVAAVARFPAAL